MKKLFISCCFSLILGSITSLNAQDSADNTLDVNLNFNDNALYGKADNLSNSATVPGFDDANQKLKITGTIFYSDGVTPAKNVILYINHPDEAGEYDYRQLDDKNNYVYHGATIITDEDGKYTFYTFIPGSPIIPITFPEKRGLKPIHPFVLEPGKQQYSLNDFVFDDDPLLSKSCRKRLKRRGIDTILTLEKQGDLSVAKKDIILPNVSQ